MARGLAVGFAVRQRIATRAQLARFFACGNSTVSARRQRMYEAEYQTLLAADARAVDQIVGLTADVDYDAHADIA
jgi:hypothetical protein